MLVLSRRQNERINFPGLGITIEVLRTSPTKVQLGIEAPAQVRVVRDELAWREDASNCPQVDDPTPASIRDDLISVATAIRLSQNQIQQGLNEHAEAALDDALHLLNRLEKSVDGIAPEPSDAGELIREKKSVYKVNTGLDVRSLVDRWFGNHFAA